MDKYKLLVIGFIVAAILAQIALAIVGVDPLSPKDVYGRLY